MVTCWFISSLFKYVSKYQEYSVKLIHFNSLIHDFDLNNSQEVSLLHSSCQLKIN